MGSVSCFLSWFVVEGNNNCAHRICFDEGYNKVKPPDDVGVRFEPYLHEILKISNSEFSVSAKYSFILFWCDNRTRFQDPHETFKEGLDNRLLNHIWTPEVNLQ